MTGGQAWGDAGLSRAAGHRQPRGEGAGPRSPSELPAGTSLLTPWLWIPGLLSRSSFVLRDPVCGGALFRLPRKLIQQRSRGVGGNPGV